MIYFNNLHIQESWILILVFLVVCHLPMLLVGKKIKRLVNFSFASKKVKVQSVLVMIIFYLLLIIALFYPITKSLTLSFIGYFLYVLGALGILISYLNYFTTANNELITKGLYQVSRNPIYVFTFIMMIGISVLCQSYVIAAMLILYFIIQHPIIKEEEKFCIDAYGDDYIKYYTQIRRYLGRK
ncbi:MAG: isoprenylcysteine carboxylmethyltransferase family protein [Cytophagales bacterium]|nr:isoprenylcysteine carboxylmethyltransferase family protein [Cytophagales bacterium]